MQFNVIVIPRTNSYNLNYGDVVYRKHDPGIKMGTTKGLEQIEFRAAVLAVTRAWRDTSMLRL